MRISKYILTIVTLLFITSGLIAQDLQYSLTTINDFKIEGDSNVRKWHADIHEADGQLLFNANEKFSAEQLQPEHFNSLTLSIPVSNISSDSNILTNNIHNNLKKDEFPEITFTLDEVADVVISNGRTVITAIGTIQAAGANHRVTMNVHAAEGNNQSIRFSGSKEMLMTDFEIDPPTAMMGAFRSVDEITIVFDVLFTKVSD